MGLILDRSGNGSGVTIEQPMNVVDFATGDKTITGKMNYLRAIGRALTDPETEQVKASLASKSGVVL